MAVLANMAVLVMATGAMNCTISSSGAEEAATVVATVGESSMLMKLRSTLTFAALDLDAELAEQDRPAVPEPGTELRADLEGDLADGLFDLLHGQAFTTQMTATPGFSGVTDVEIVSIDNGLMDGHGTSPVFYAFAEFEVEVEAQVDPCCVSVDDLRRSEACAQSAIAIADMVVNATTALQSSLYEDGLDVWFSDSGDDAFSRATLRAADFEVLADERYTTVCARKLRMQS